MTRETDQLICQEKELEFVSFSNQDAWELGKVIVDLALQEGLSIAVLIMKNGHRLFHYSFEGTTKNNDNWLEAKARTVDYYEHSSLFTQIRLKHEGKTVTQDAFISEEKYFAVGGGFPIRTKSCGVVGAVVVSGLTPEDDHCLVVRAITLFLEGKLKNAEL